MNVLHDVPIVPMFDERERAFRKKGFRRLVIAKRQQLMVFELVFHVNQIDIKSLNL